MNDISELFSIPDKFSFPDTNITIGMAFEVDGAYESFGYLALYENIPFAAGRDLKRLRENMIKNIDKARN